ncbi:MAG TPA: DUF1543 domain-containing protein [Terricaulis sp.]|nr:DUF1543 domain-containing protein [Terricaulis sp.]
MSAPLKLYAVLVGGAHPRASIELHDVQFVAGRSIEETYPLLRQRWWGTPGSLHIDAYAELETVDGFDIIPTAAAARGDVALYFVNTGGYTPGLFNEFHAFSFHVGRDKPAIWAAARARAAFESKHKDNFDQIDDVLCIDEALAAQNIGLALRPAPGKADAVHVTARYIPIG